MKTAIFFLFPVLLILAGRELTAQNKPERRQEFADNYYRLGNLQMSEDGKWLIARKSYARNRDTLLVFNSRSPGQPVACRAKAGRSFFTGKACLLLLKPKQAELLKLNGLTSIYFQGVKKIQELKSKKQFALHYNGQENNRLELRDSGGRLLNTLDRVTRFYTTKNDCLYAVTKNEADSSSVVLMSGEKKQELYTSSQKIEYLDIDTGGQGIIIHKMAPGDGFPAIAFLDLETKRTYPLSEILPVAFRRAFPEQTGKENSYFLKLYADRKKECTSPVDVWYGNDNKLEQKFYPPDRENCYLWEPQKKQVQRIGTDLLTQNVNIGNARYFLSFDPYLLQDYTGPTLRKINVYDRLEDRYSLIDTISGELHISPNGKYLLYPKNNAWYAYNITGGIKKAIRGDGLQIPYFTSTEGEVVFTGNGGLLKYDLKTNSRTGFTDFNGYRATILNAGSDVINKFNFYRKTLAPGKPLLLQLFDSVRNKNTYVLLDKGKCKTIIRSTGFRIKNLVYNDDYTHFYYTEENYNLPPRLVLKEAEKKEQVIYESNKADKAVLSLKQKIISYTNSDSIPLKGILYYPLNYNPSLKYPMVVHIYEKQRHLSNRYLSPSYYEGLGFNIRLFLENGYFVYLPDIVTRGKNGPGIDALNCVNNALDALTGNPLIDKEKIGLIGHSFGGYETDFIATRSNRFAAYISGSGHSDIVWAANAFNYNFLFPDYVRIEANMYKMGVPFFKDKALYLQNNPVYHAEKVSAPVLLWSGNEDQNVTSDHTMAFYNALRRNKKDVGSTVLRGRRAWPVKNTGSG